MKRGNLCLSLGLMMIGLSLTGCSKNDNTIENVTTTLEVASNNTKETTSASNTITVPSSTTASDDTTTENTVNTSSSAAISGAMASQLSVTSVFSNRDLEQTADLTDATEITLSSGNDVTITEEGIYVLTGTVTETTIIVEAGDTDKVQLVLDNVSITNETAPAIYVKTGDKVFITTTDSSNTLKVSGTFVADGETNLDAVIFSKSDLVLNGVGTLNVTSAKGNGITSKDDLKVTGGTYVITSAYDSLEANDSIVICDGSFTINSGKDALHSENEDDLSLGYIYICGGTFDITSKSDGIQGTSVVQIDGGNINIGTCLEGIEGTYVQINDGTIQIYATDDGINATNKSSYYDVYIEINGGDITINMGAGDTDAVDSNGDVTVNGGTIIITGNSSFDFDGTGELNGGTVTVNGSKITTMPTQMGGGGGRPMGNPRW